MKHNLAHQYPAFILCGDYNPEGIKNTNERADKTNPTSPYLLDSFKMLQLNIARRNHFTDNSRITGFYFILF